MVGLERHVKNKRRGDPAERARDGAWKHVSNYREQKKNADMYQSFGVLTVVERADPWNKSKHESALQALACKLGHFNIDRRLEAFSGLDDTNVDIWRPEETSRLKRSRSVLNSEACW